MRINGTLSLHSHRYDLSQYFQHHEIVFIVQIRRLRPREVKVTELIKAEMALSSFSKSEGTFLGTTAAYHERLFSCLIINPPKHGSNPQIFVWIPLIK